HVHELGTGVVHHVRRVATGEPGLHDGGDLLRLRELHLGLGEQLLVRRDVHVGGVLGAQAAVEDDDLEGRVLLDAQRVGVGLGALGLVGVAVVTAAEAAAQQADAGNGEQAGGRGATEQLPPVDTRAGFGGFGHGGSPRLVLLAPFELKEVGYSRESLDSRAVLCPATAWAVRWKAACARSCVRCATAMYRRSSTTSCGCRAESASGRNVVACVAVSRMMSATSASGERGKLVRATVVAPWLPASAIISMVSRV